MSGISQNEWFIHSQFPPWKCGDRRKL